MHLAVAFDKNYLEPFYALVTSVFANRKDGQTIYFHCIATGLADGQREQIISYVEKNASAINFYTVDEEFVGKFVLVNEWTPAVYYRLFFPLLVSQELTRILYLDCDIIVNNSLDELYFTDLKSYPVAAVYDNYVKTQPLLGITNEGEYFNSGMLLINLPLWRDQQISEKAISFLQKYPERILFVDQCALNGVLHNKWMKLPEKFNLLYSFIPQGMSVGEAKRFAADKVVIHYTLSRPWSLACRNPYKDLYFHYLKRSPIKVGKKYKDVRYDTIVEYFRLKIINLYFNTPWFQGVWRKLRKS